MASYHIVEEGENLLEIAQRFGFRQYRRIWNHPNNSALKTKRRKPNVLTPGDRLYIPDLQPHDESCTNEHTHTFQVSETILKLRLILEDRFEKPIAGAHCILVISGTTRTIVTDNQGRIEQKLPLDVRDITLKIQGNETAIAGTSIAIKVGGLRPIDELSGQAARLNNLGYFAGEPEVNSDKAFCSAVEEFQCDYGLQVDGICGSHTQDKLEQVHGS